MTKPPRIMGYLSEIPTIQGIRGWLQTSSDCWATKCAMASNETLRASERLFFSTSPRKWVLLLDREVTKAVVTEIHRRVEMGAWDI